MSHVAGDSFAYSGFDVRERQPATIWAELSGASSTFGHERLSSITSTSVAIVETLADPGVVTRREAADRDPHAQPVRGERGQGVRQSRPSIPGPCSPIELSMPDSVSAIRTGGLPSRGSGVIVFVTNASSSSATSGAVSASRQPLALRDRDRHAARRTGPAMHSRCRRPSTSTTQP